MKTIILASESPRRKELLRKTGLKFTVDPSNYEEKINEKLSADKLAKLLSFKKAQTIVPKYKNALIIAADTLVVIGNKTFGKPDSEEKAKEMLRILSGKMHYVITGFTIYDTGKNKFITKFVKSRVYFNKISKQDINKYVSLKKPFDKGGGYGIQELPKTFIKKVKGDYANVIGLPTQALLKELKKLGVKVL